MCLGKLFMGETPKTTLSASVDGKNYTQVQNLEIPENGLIVYLKKFWYEVQRNLSLQVARDFILEHLEQRVGLNAHSQIPVNA